MIKNLGFVGVIVVILVAVGILAGLFLYAQKIGLLSENNFSEQNQELDEANGWKTYINKQYEFEIKYPSENCALGMSKFVLFDCNTLGEDGTDKFGEINIHVVDIPAGKNFQDVVLANTVFDGSGMNPTSISKFTQVRINKLVFYKIKTGRFEGVLSYVYYLQRDNVVFAFSFTSRGVDWTNPNLDEEADSTHVILKQMLSTLKFTS